jgi:hypothetical protein
MNFAEIQSMIKGKIANLYPQRSMESFTMPPYEEPDMTNAPAEIKAYIDKYKIVPRETYDVMKKFELPAKSLTKDERALRKKYLNIVKQIIADEYNNIKEQAKKGIPQDARVYMDEVKVYVLYVIDLMIQDIDLVDNPTTTNCPQSETCPKNYNMIFGGVIAVLVVLLLVVLMMR